MFDLWEVRACFQHGYGNTPYFVSARDRRGELVGLLPLSLLAEGGVGFFPGETWNGETWLENNRFIAADPRILTEMLQAVPEPLRLRYIAAEGWGGWEEDEFRYLFFPADYGFSYEAYRQALPPKRLKRLQRELDEMVAGRTLEVRREQTADIGEFIRLNLAAFGDESYFADSRFLNGFELLLEWLRVRGKLRVTTVLIGGEVAAVDVGAVHNNVCTLLAGGTDPRFPGVAKLINFNHIENACFQGWDCLDFLCGDFGWKERFNLTPRPLYRIDRLPPAVPHPGIAAAILSDA